MIDDGIRQTWARLCAIELDHQKIGIVHAAHDRNADVLYVYDAILRPRGDLAILAATLKDKGAWIPVIYDHKRVDEEDGIRTAERLAELGVDIATASASPEIAATEIAIRLSSGRLKVYDHLEAWFAEYRRYRRDDKGEIDASDARLIGATGLIVIHLGFAVSEAKAKSDREPFDLADYNRQRSLTGY